MSRTIRCFVAPPVPAGAVEVVLEGPEAHHLLHVLRVKAGDEVTLFDGSGVEFSATVVAAKRAVVELQIWRRLEVDRETSIQVTLAVALPKGDRQQWLVEKAVELGVHRVVPLITDRGVAQPVEKALERLRRAVVEASKQCGRNRLLMIDEPRSLADILTQPSDDEHRTYDLGIVAHPTPSAATLRQLLERWQWPERSQSRIVAAIGPEGGFSDPELQRFLAADWNAVQLGARILRVETAALALASGISHWFGQ